MQVGTLKFEKLKSLNLQFKKWNFGNFEYFKIRNWENLEFGCAMLSLDALLAKEYEKYELMKILQGICT